MRQIYKHVLIFSVYQSNKPNETNVNNHNGVWNILKTHNIPFKTVEGVYKDTPETSFIVNVDQIEMVKDMCKKFNQECYLERFSDNSCQLVYGDGKRYDIGQMRQVSETIAKNANGYTYDSKNDTYWMAV